MSWFQRTPVATALALVLVTVSGCAKVTNTEVKRGELLSETPEPDQHKRGRVVEFDKETFRAHLEWENADCKVNKREYAKVAHESIQRMDSGQLIADQVILGLGAGVIVAGQYIPSTADPAPTIVAVGGIAIVGMSEGGHDLDPRQGATHRGHP